MKIFVVGLPKSCRTSVSKAIAEAYGFGYIDAMSWVRSTFRNQKEDEHPQQYEDDYQQYLTKRMLVNPNFVINHVSDMMQIHQHHNFVIDGVASPQDFANLFDFRQDIVVFLNRTDNESDHRDHESIGVSVIRDYCFWMSAAGVLPKERWLEYNFKVPGDDSDYVKQMGAQNSVFIVRSLNKVISHLSERIKR